MHEDITAVMLSPCLLLPDTPTVLLHWHTYLCTLCLPRCISVYAAVSCAGMQVLPGPCTGGSSEAAPAAAAAKAMTKAVGGAAVPAAES
jgi:hypothetical protein